MAFRVFLVFGVSVFIGCGKPEPNRATLLKTVETLQTSLAKKDIVAELKLMLIPEGAPIEKLKKALTSDGMAENLSAEGVKHLVAKAKFGKLAALFPKQGARRVERYKIPVDECYALKLKSAEVMAHWKDGKFRIFRMDDVGSKLVRQMKE